MKDVLVVLADVPGEDCKYVEGLLVVLRDSKDLLEKYKRITWRELDGWLIDGVTVRRAWALERQLSIADLKNELYR